MIIAITGPTGSGKTTIAAELVKHLPKGVNIEVDHVKHFIASGFRSEDQPDGSTKWEYDEWPLCGDSIGLLAKNFQDKGYTIIISGYMDESGWEAVQKHVDLDQKFLLLPQIDATKERDAARAEDNTMGEQAVMEHHANFSTNPYYGSFTSIDSTEHAARDTVRSILDLI